MFHSQLYKFQANLSKMLTAEYTVNLSAVSVRTTQQII